MFDQNRRRTGDLRLRSVNPKLRFVINELVICFVYMLYTEHGLDWRLHLVLVAIKLAIEQ